MCGKRPSIAKTVFTDTLSSRLKGNLNCDLGRILLYFQFEALVVLLLHPKVTLMIMIMPFAEQTALLAF